MLRRAVGDDMHKPIPPSNMNYLIKDSFYSYSGALSSSEVRQGRGRTGVVPKGAAMPAAYGR